MVFKSKDEIFGDDAGFGAKVPVSESNPAGTSIGNRGVQFGEQVAAGTANRPAYALAENTDDLDARVALWEASGLDAAYDLGAAAVPGGGRVITKDDGAIETRSANAAMYDEDIANAHFRADLSGDGVNGGVGLDVVGYGRSGTGNHLASVLDRRAITPSNYSILSATVAVTLNIGGADPDGLTIGAGQLRDGSSNTDLIMGYDLVEVLSGPHAGVYVILNLVSGVACTLVNLDGTSPAFTSSTVSTGRFFRPTMSASSRYGSSGTHEHRSMVLSGVPGQESALDLIGGSVDADLVDAGLSPDGARKAMRVRRRSLTGVVADRLTIDAAGRVRSTVTTDDLTAVQKIAKGGFSSAAFTAQQDAGSGNPTEVGFLARSNHAGAMARHFGLAAFEDVFSAATPLGIFAFNFLASDLIDFTDIAMADSAILPGFTLVEILTPAAYAGIYRVTSRSSNDGNVGLTRMAGAVTAFPGSGAGTCRVLYGSSFGTQDMPAAGTYSIEGTDFEGRASAVLQSPKEAGGSALVLEASSLGEYLARGLFTEDGNTQEVYRVTAEGALYAKSFHRSSSVSRTFLVPLPDFIPGSPTIDPGDLEFTEGLPTISAQQLVFRANSLRATRSMSQLLRHGETITNIQVIVDPGEARASTSRVSVSLYRVTPDFSVAANNPIESVLVAQTFDDTTTNKQIISMSADLGGGHVVDTEVREYYLEIKAGATAGSLNDTVYGVMVTVSQAELETR